MKLSIKLCLILIFYVSILRAYTLDDEILARQQQDQVLHLQIQEVDTNRTASDSQTRLLALSGGRQGEENREHIASLERYNGQVRTMQTGVEMVIRAYDGKRLVLEGFYQKRIDGGVGDLGGVRITWKLGYNYLQEQTERLERQNRALQEKLDSLERRYRSFRELMETYGY